MVPYPSVITGHREHRRHHHRGNEVVGLAEPVYIPYAVPYAVDSDDAAEEQDDADAGLSSGAATERPSASAGSKAGRRQYRASGVPEDRGQKAGVDPVADAGYVAGGDSETEAAPAAPEVPVVTQPTTVLVFKDGHRLEVVNYAIVGDMLFDFSGDRAHKIPIADLDIPATQKVNDAAGVEFRLPPTGDVKSGAN